MAEQVGGFRLKEALDAACATAHLSGFVHERVVVDVALEILKECTEAERRERRIVDVRICSTDFAERGFRVDGAAYLDGPAFRSERASTGAF